MHNSGKPHRENAGKGLQGSAGILANAATRSTAIRLRARNGERVLFRSA